MAAGASGWTDTRVELAVSRILRLGLALAFLHTEFDAPIPASVLAMVRGRPTLVEQLENRSILADPSSRFALDSYRWATVLRMLLDGAPMAIPALVWHKLTQRA